MIVSIFILSLIGFAIATYATITEKKIEENPDYKPACDINDRISCSKPLKSPYAKLFFISNSLLSMIFYGAMALLAFIGAHTLILLGSIAACAVSAYLAYLLYFKIKSLCLVCTSLYVVNILLLIASLIS